jgi:hypothetical protein
VQLAINIAKSNYSPTVTAYVGLLSSSNSKFKTSLGHSSPWATIEVNQLARRLDISAHKIFEFGIADLAVSTGNPIVKSRK